MLEGCYHVRWSKRWNAVLVVSVGSTNRQQEKVRIKFEAFWTALRRNVSCAKYSVFNLKNLFSSSLEETDLLYGAKVYRDDRLRKKAESMSMDNCKELERLTSLYRGGWTTIIHVHLYVCCYLSCKLRRDLVSPWMLEKRGGCKTLLCSCFQKPYAEISFNGFFTYCEI